MTDPLLNIPSQNSESYIWKEFHKSLTAVFGKQKGNEIFMAYWNDRGNKKAIDADLLEYLNDKGITIDAPLAARWSLAAQDTFENIKSRMSSLFKFSLGGTVAVTLIAIVIIIMVLRAILKDPEKWGKAIGSGAGAFVKPPGM